MTNGRRAGLIYIGGTTLALAAASPVRADAFGLALAALDDLDGDGAPELLIGDPYDTEADEDLPGRVWVVSGASGQVLRTHRGELAGDYFGDCVARVGDLDGDGLRDYAVSAPFPMEDLFGTVRVHSGRNGLLLLELETPGPWGATAIVDAGDVDGDGTPDLALGIPRKVGREGTGVVLVVSGRTGEELRTLSTGRSFGADVVVMDDFDGDGVRELAVGARAELWQRGAVDVFAGADGARMATLPIPGLLGGGDFDGDGRLDLLAGEGGHCETVTAWSLATGASIRVWSSPRAVSVSTLGDVDGDGTIDLVVGAQVELMEPAWVRVLSGRTSEVLREHVLGDALEVLCSGMTVLGGPDLDCDGVADYVAGTGTTSASAECCFVRAYSGRTGEPLYELSRARLAAGLRRVDNPK